MKIFILIGELKKELYVEGIYKLPVKNIVDYEKTLSVDEAIAQSETEFDRAEKIRAKLEKKNKAKKKKEQIEEDEEENVNNQILNFGNKPIKKDF